uniref:CMP-N-acetylneuraminate-beta-galactosamide-alpha-2,3-sialyltransferase 2 n=1 Tax=Poecilia reticulata TaxID=8081 RepID=A0A3P9PQ71_POERE
RRCAPHGQPPGTNPPASQCLGAEGTAAPHFTALCRPPPSRITGQEAQPASASASRRVNLHSNRQFGARALAQSSRGGADSPLQSALRRASGGYGAPTSTGTPRASPERLQWLQSERQPANFSEVVEELFQVIPDDVLYVDASPERCRSCAVVGNSGNLKRSRYGGLIDACDFIIRMNQAPTSGFEEDVGTRTTHHVMYPESAIDLDNNTSLVLIPFKTLDLQWLISALTTGAITHTYLPVKARIKANKDKVLIYSPTFFKYVHESWLEGHGRYPSTGFLSLLLALHICDEVSVFGFGADRYGNWHHYWETNHLAGAFRHTGVHDGDYEYNVTLLLADKHKIQMFTGR